MPRINLLPWREAERKKRQQDFMISLTAAVIVAGAFVGLTLFAFVQMIENQQSRNVRLETEIAELEKSISEIDGLERQKERLLARMEIIEQLQRSRPEIVHLFDELTRQIPEGVYLNGMTQQGRNVELKGVAQSSTRVSALMRQTDASEWLSDPNVTRVETTENGPARQAEFVVTLKQVSPGIEMEEEL
ncbi:MAG: PilN domain-containing protein [Gammaproteobacteria bacterium]|jgi:type IV pilus assembly protein PilN|nr:PilN domain-containing protein [Gammaproteobacteria bacterium]MDH5344448.1 PilN domain-containing protein [Gammaproteobacteria bacterium]